jgi:hypothetical protein
MTPFIRQTTAAIALALLFTGIATACPTCKDSLSHDPATANLARGYAYSILFMLSMPPLIFGSLTLYFYWEVRKARSRAAAEKQPANLAALE